MYLPQTLGVPMTLQQALVHPRTQPTVHLVGQYGDLRLAQRYLILTQSG